MLSISIAWSWIMKFCNSTFFFFPVVFYFITPYSFLFAYFYKTFVTFRSKVCKGHVLVRSIKLHQRRFCGGLTLIVYSLAVNLQVHGVLEGLLSLIQKAKSRIKLTCAYIESRAIFVMWFFFLLYLLSIFCWTYFPLEHGTSKLDFNLSYSPTSVTG